MKFIEKMVKGIKVRLIAGTGWTPGLNEIQMKYENRCQLWQLRVKSLTISWQQGKDDHCRQSGLEKPNKGVIILVPDMTLSV